MRSFIPLSLLSLFFVTVTNCSEEVPTGILSANLLIAPSVDVTEINYEITGQGFDPITGTLQVTSNPVSASMVGVPAGINLVIKLFTSDSKCSGTATFDMIAGQTTTVQVPIQCQGTPQRGNILVNGTFLLCPMLTAVVVSPSQVQVPGTIHLSAIAKNFDQGALTYLWTATAGIIEDATATKTTYTCSVAGDQTLIITASNVNGCYDALSVIVKCTDGSQLLCSNGVVDAGENCDIAIATGQAGACPSNCNDGNACTTDTLQNAGTCQAACAHLPITTCASGDSCCPNGCNVGNDSDCSAKCGDGVVTAPETCDPPSSCPTSCDDENACTTDTITGSAATCNVACVHQAIAACVSGDNCCPQNCDLGNDSDCVLVCPGTNVIGNLNDSPQITLVPPANGAITINGTVQNIDPTKAKVVIWVLTNIWYVQPTVANPFTPICSDGSWTTSTHPWKHIVALITDSTYEVRDGVRYYHPSLDPGVLAWTQYPPGPATIDFSGYTWGIKMADDPFDPGPNRWSSEPENVSVDSQGRLHLRISQREGFWYCAEVALTKSLGYGTYTVQLATPLTGRDQNSVFSPFLYETPVREIDFECAGTALIPSPNNAQFVIQPYTNTGNLHRFTATSDEQTTVRISWHSDRVEFMLWRGWGTYPPPDDQVLESWIYTGTDIPPPGSERFHFNLWLVGGQAPVNGQGDEVIVEFFAFQPY